MNEWVVSPHAVWACSMFAMVVGGVMFRLLPREPGEQVATARGVVGGVWMVLFALTLSWWHFSR